MCALVTGVQTCALPIYDTTEGSLYRRLVLEGPRIPVKIWLLRENGESMFTGQGIIPGTTIPSTGSAKNDAYRWYMERYMKKGNLDRKSVVSGKSVSVRVNTGGRRIIKKTKIKYK